MPAHGYADVNLQQLGNIMAQDAKGGLFGAYMPLALSCAFNELNLL